MEEHNLFHADPEDGDRLGRVVDLSDDLVVSTVKGKSGYAFRFGNGAWRELAALVPDDPPSSDTSYAVDVDGKTVFVTDLGPNDGEGTANLYDVLDLALSDVLTGSFLSLETCGGQSNGPALLWLTAVDGAPLLMNLALGTFDAGGRWLIEGNAPPAASGLTLTFQSVGFYLAGRPGLSQAVSVPIP